MGEARFMLNKQTDMLTPTWSRNYNLVESKRQYMSKTAKETTQRTKAPLCLLSSPDKSKKHLGRAYAEQTWREESSDIKLESTKLKKKIREKKLDAYKKCYLKVSMLSC